MRNKIIAGNWKMNLDKKATGDLINTLKPLLEKADSKIDIVFCVPFVNLSYAAELLKDCRIALGAQNMHYEDSGAFTGEISAEMLVSVGAKYVVIGHSERRAYFHETDTDINKKAIKAIEKSLVPIICVGETLIQREQGITIDLVRTQTRIALMNISAEQAKKVVIAYEPVWAIGTGRTATNDQAQEVCKAIRDLVCELYGAAVADELRIQYGGSVNEKNAAELFAMKDIDGGLVGGASLKEDFAKIVCYK